MPKMVYKPKECYGCGVTRDDPHRPGCYKSTQGLPETGWRPADHTVMPGCTCWVCQAIREGRAKWPMN